ncbi:glycosyltransferase family 9 protein, partial [Planctomycetota bacterium]
MKTSLKKLLLLSGLSLPLQCVRRAALRCYEWLGNRAFRLLGYLPPSPDSTSIDKDKIARILVVRLDRLGDLVLSTPLFRAIKEGFPSATLSLLINSYTKDLVINNPWVDEILSYGEKSAGEILRKVKESHFDLVLVLHDNLLGNQAAFRSRAAYRIGYDSNRSSFLMTHVLADDRNINVRPYVETNLDFAGFLGLEPKNEDVEISLTEEGERFADAFFEDHSIRDKDVVVCIHPG